MTQSGESARCNFLIDCGDMLRCGCPEDHELHDPLGPHGHHVYDPAPAEDGSYIGGWVSQTPPEAALALMDATPETRRYAPSAALPIDNRASDTGGSGSG